MIYAKKSKAIARDLSIRVINKAMGARIGSDVNYSDYLLPHIREGDVLFYRNQRWFVELTQAAEANERRGA